jgi:hypothetical protein
MTDNEIERNDSAVLTSPVVGGQVPPDVTPLPGPPPAPAARRGGGIVPAILFLLIVLLAAGEAWLWHGQQIAGRSGDIAALQAQIDALKAQPASPEMAAAASSSQAASSATPSALHPAPAAAAPASAADQAQLAQLAQMGPKLAALSAQVNAMGDELSADHGIVTGLQTDTAKLGKLSDHVAAMEKLSAARQALDSGQPVGMLPGAPPALARYATAAPPTEAQLRLGFPAAVQAAQQASVAADGAPSFWSRVRARVEGLITISDGTHVIVGAPAAAVLAQAQGLLDAGDLAGAVGQINTLSAPTQAAMGDWLTQARDVLAARAAIASLYGQS